jgi:hypothetical protein
MYNWYLLSLQSFIIHTAQVTYILYIALPLTNPNPTYLAPSSCDGNVHLSPRLLVNCPLLSPIAPAYPSPTSLHPFWVFPGPNVLLIRTHPNPFPSERNKYNHVYSVITKYSRFLGTLQYVYVIDLCVLRTL